MADNTASASAFASKASTGRLTPNASRGPVWPTSNPEANSSCSSGSPPWKTGPTSNNAKSITPRAWFRWTACNNPGSSDGRMWLISDDIGLPIITSSAPPPKRSADFLSIKEYVTHSLYPNAAIVRRAIASLRCIGVKIGLGTPSANWGRGTPTSLVSDAIRATSSTRSAEPRISGRQLGTWAWSPSMINPKSVRYFIWSSDEISIPTSDSILLVSSVYDRDTSGTAPAFISAEASPPPYFCISVTAWSHPLIVNNGSTPLSNLYRASELIFNLRPVIAILVGSQYALSTKTFIVLSSQPVSSPPIIPAILSTPLSSDIIIISFCNTYSLSSSAVIVSPPSALWIRKFPETLSISKTWRGRLRS